MLKKISQKSKQKVLDFFKRHSDKVVWPQICVNKNISLQYFEDNIEKVHWDYLSGKARKKLTSFNQLYFFRNFTF